MIRFLVKVREAFMWRFASRLLRSAGTITIPATKSLFSVKEKDWAFLNKNFKNWFLGKTEESMPEARLRYADLIKSSADGPILAELGERAEVTLGQLYALMEQEMSGQESPLLIGGEWRPLPLPGGFGTLMLGVNVFYIRDARGELRSVTIMRLAPGWSVTADSVASPRIRGNSPRVFFRDS